MGSASGLLAEARKSLGLGEPNHIQRWYAARHGSAYGYNFPWCDAAVSYWADRSGNASAVGEFAYTVYHAQWFQRDGRWHEGTAGIRRGDIVFFDWSGTRDIGRIDHVGVVERVDGGEIVTIEGNIGDRCKRVVRDSRYIAGYGRPAYDGGSAGSASRWMEDMVRDLPLLKKGARGEHVETLQGLLLARSHPEIEIDGVFDAEVEAAVKRVQKWGKVAVDGQVGPQTWPVLLRVHT